MYKAPAGIPFTGQEAGEEAGVRGANMDKILFRGMEHSLHLENGVSNQKKQHVRTGGRSGRQER